MRGGGPAREEEGEAEAEERERGGAGGHAGVGSGEVLGFLGTRTEVSEGWRRAIGARVRGFVGSCSSGVGW